MGALTVSDCMTRDIYALAPDTCREVAARLFTAKHISGAPVVDESGKGVGVVTLHDLTDPDRTHGTAAATGRFYLLSGGKLEEKDGGKWSCGRVEDIMTAFVVSVPSDMPVSEAMRLMVTDGIHRLFVHDEAKRIAGIVTSMDILRALLT